MVALTRVRELTLFLVALTGAYPNAGGSEVFWLQIALPAEENSTAQLHARGRRVSCARRHAIQIDSDVLQL